MPTTRLDTVDAAELTELLQFVKEWLTTDNGPKPPSQGSSEAPATTPPTSAPT
jgi:hypothetical protein